MKNTHRGLHLVSAEEAAALAQPSQQAGTPPDNSRFVTTMVWYYRELRDELAGLGDEPDQERILALRAKKKAVRRVLALYGVRVGA